MKAVDGEGDVDRDVNVDEDGGQGDGEWRDGLVADARETRERRIRGRVGMCIVRISSVVAFFFLGSP